MNDRIHIPFHPLDFEKKGHAIEKSDGTGIKRKYLYGISTGVKTDGDGERITLNCLKSLQSQAESGNILLYAGLHGVNFIDDLGILRDSEIKDVGDWITGYRLYDEYDEESVGSETIQRSQKLWSQVLGLGPYSKGPVQKGFSIEGVVPESEILSKKIDPRGNWTQRVINDMILDGVLVVNRPAYTSSFITAVHKRLGEYTPESQKKLHTKYASILSDALSKKKSEKNFYQKFFEINSMLEESISSIMRIPESDGRVQQRLEILFDEYKTLMVALILQNANVFQDIVSTSDILSDQDSFVAQKQEQLMGQFASAARQFSNLISKRLGGKR